jgi:hypothetical protein
MIMFFSAVFVDGKNKIEEAWEGGETDEGPNFSNFRGELSNQKWHLNRVRV